MPVIIILADVDVPDKYKSLQLPVPAIPKSTVALFIGANVFVEKTPVATSVNEELPNVDGVLNTGILFNAPAGGLIFPLNIFQSVELK